MNLTLAGFLKFFENLPFTQIEGAIAAEGTDIPLDFAAGQAILTAALQDFASGAPATAAGATATTSAVAAHIAASS